MTLEYSTILPGHLYVGKAPQAPDLAALRAIGVTAVLSLIHPSDPYQVPDEVRESMVWEGIAIKDSFLGGVPSLEQLRHAVETLTAWRRDGHRLYLHCLLGQGRSPLVAMAYLVLGNHEEPDPAAHRLTAAIAQVKHTRPQADPNVHQLAILCQLVQATVAGKSGLLRKGPE